MSVDEEGQAQPSGHMFTIFSDEKKHKSIEEILNIMGTLLSVIALVVILIRLIAQQEIKKATFTQKQRDAIYDLSARAFSLHEWRTRQIAQHEAWRAIDDWKTKECDTAKAEPVPEHIDPVKHSK